MGEIGPGEYVLFEDRGEKGAGMRCPSVKPLYSQSASQPVSQLVSQSVNQSVSQSVMVIKTCLRTNVNGDWECKEQH